MSKRFVKLKKYAEIPALALLLFTALVISLNSKYQRAVISGIELWAAAVLPALFPYLVITSFVSSLKITGKIAEAFSPLTNKLFNVSGNVGYALFISLMSGYPLGAKTVSDLKLKGLIGETESVRAAALCSSSSPVFLIGSVGNLAFNSPFFGVLLFITHVLSVFIVGFIFSFYKRKDRPQKQLSQKRGAFINTSDNVLYDGVYSAVVSVLVVGGIITVFYLLTEILNNVGLLGAVSKVFNTVLHDESLSKGLATGIFECTKGIKIIAGKGVSFLTLPLCAFLCGFGGISVIAQSVAYLKKAKIKTAPFFLSKTLAAVVNFLLGLILSAVFLA